MLLTGGSCNPVGSSFDKDDLAEIRVSKAKDQLRGQACFAIGTGVCIYRGKMRTARGPWAAVSDLAAENLHSVAILTYT